MAPEKLKTMLIQIFEVTNKQDYGMLWYFLEWPINILAFVNVQNFKTSQSILSYVP